MKTKARRRVSLLSALAAPPKLYFADISPSGTSCESVGLCRVRVGERKTRHTRLGHADKRIRYARPVRQISVYLDFDSRRVGDFDVPHASAAPAKFGCSWLGALRIASRRRSDQREDRATEQASYRCHGVHFPAMRTAGK